MASRSIPNPSSGRSVPEFCKRCRSGSPEQKISSPNPKRQKKELNELELYVEASSKLKEQEFDSSSVEASKLEEQEVDSSNVEASKLEEQEVDSSNVEASMLEEDDDDSSSDDEESSSEEQEFDVGSSLSNVQEVESSSCTKRLSTQASIEASLWNEEELEQWHHIFSRVQELNCLQERRNMLIASSLAPELADVSARLEELQNSKFKSLPETECPKIAATCSEIGSICTAIKSMKEYKTAIEASLWGEEEFEEWHHIFSLIQELNCLREGRNMMIITSVAPELADVSARLEEMKSKFKSRTSVLDSACTVVKSTEEFMATITTNEKVVCLFYDEVSMVFKGMHYALVQLAISYSEMTFLKVNAREVPELVENLREDPVWDENLKEFPIVALVDSGRLKACLRFGDFFGGRGSIANHVANLLRRHAMLTDPNPYWLAAASKNTYRPKSEIKQKPQI